ncbi:MAG: hypothetical protein EPO20_20100 [Betaproteobacteria bacterium]|nr:MAG: hypothetical protein EPO20_20100 [Betaproteobacteria bacterium]
MTDLQLGLLIIGAVAVAGVLVYNRVQERATRRDAQRAFGSQHADALLGEPAARREPTIDALAQNPQPQARPGIDYVIELEGTSAERLGAEWAGLERRFAPRATLADSGPDSAQAALQMVSRDGVIGEARLLEFRSQVESIAAAHGATVSAPEMRQALDAAQELDRACVEVDIQIALHVLGVPQAELPPGESFQAAPRADGVTLLLDVPRTAELEKSYEAMVRTARDMAAAHGGRLVDDNGKPLDERALSTIRAELDAVRARLAELGIEPGSPLALRVFS